MIDMLFSIIVPCYNVETYINKCVDSILNQSFKDFEVILVDDGAKDSTAKILDNYQDLDSRIRVIHKENGGLTSARKAGADIALGDYIIPVDGDDWVSEDYIEQFYNVVSKHHPDVIVCGLIRATETKEKYIYPPKVNNRYGFFDRNSLEEHLFSSVFYFNPYLCSKAIKADLYKKYQMSLNEKVIMGEDSAVSIPCIVASDSMFIVEKCMYYYRWNPTSLTNSRRKVMSWDGSMLRIKHLEENLPLEKYDLEKQLSCAFVHTFTNVLLSHLRNEKYSDVRKDVLKRLASPETQKYIKIGFSSPRKKERIAAYALCSKLIIAFKLWSKIQSR